MVGVAVGLLVGFELGWAVVGRGEGGGPVHISAVSVLPPEYESPWYSAVQLISVG